MDIIKEIISLKKTHYYCDDSCYSCPKAQDGCADESKGTYCDCGVEEQHNKIDSIIKELQ